MRFNARENQRKAVARLMPWFEVAMVLLSAFVGLIHIVGFVLVFGFYLLLAAPVILIALLIFRTWKIDDFR